MKKITFVLIALLLTALAACSNPVSSEFDNTNGEENGHGPLYSGHSQNG